MGQTCSNTEIATLFNTLQGIVRNQCVLAEALGVKVVFAEADLQQLIHPDPKETAIQLPPDLQRTMRNRNAFRRAVQQGYIRSSSDGRLEWTLGNITLLAYFCGAIWCGDKSLFNKRNGKGYWHQGTGRFPQAALTRLFGALNLKKLRQNREEQVLPVDYEIVDQLLH